MRNISSNICNVASINDVIATNIEEMKIRYESKNHTLGMNTGLVDFDYMMDGIHKGEITIIGGRPVTGKTVFALNMASNMARESNLSVLYISLAESEHVIGKKLLALNANVPIDKIASGNLIDNDWQRINRAYEEFENMSLSIKYAVELSAKEVDALCMGNEGLDVIFIDYLQLMLYENNFCNRKIECGHLINELKHIAKKYNVAIILLSQLYSKLENQVNKKPKRIDFMELNLKSDFDNLIGIYRDEYFDRLSSDKEIMEIHMLVNKHKSAGTCLTAFLPEYCKVINL